MKIKEFYDKLCCIRRQKVKKAELARAIGCSRENISNLFFYNKDLPEIKITKLLKHFSINLEQLTDTDESFKEENKEMDIKDRLNLVLKHLNITQAELSRQINIGKGSVSAYLSGKGNPGGKFLLLLQTKYNINPAWVKYGEGTMFLTEELDSIEVLANKHGCTVEEYELVMKFLDEEKDLALYAAKTVINKDQKARERFIKLTES